MATDLYVGAWDNPSQKAFFGKIHSDTGAYTQISSEVGSLVMDWFTGLAWDPSISAFHTRSMEGWVNSITKTGTTGPPSKSNQRGRAPLVYNPQTNQLHCLKAEYRSIDKNNNKAYSIDGAAFVKGKLCCTVTEITSQREQLARYGREQVTLYGFLDVNKDCFQPISASDRAYEGMQLAYDGSTLFGLKNYSLYTLNPETGAYIQVAEVTGISQGNMMLQCRAAIPVIAS